MLNQFLRLEDKFTKLNVHHVVTNKSANRAFSSHFCIVFDPKTSALPMFFIVVHPALTVINLTSSSTKKNIWKKNGKKLPRLRRQQGGKQKQSYQSFFEQRYVIDSNSATNANLAQIKVTCHSIETTNDFLENIFQKRCRASTPEKN